MRFAHVLLALVFFDCTQPEAPKRDEHVSVGPPDPPEVHFSPHGGCQEAIVKHIDATKRTLFVEAYSFTSKPIADAIIRAHVRGVKTYVTLDKSALTASKSELDELLDAKVDTRIDSKHAIAHNKVMIFDGKLVETGSYNYTAAAENSNAENCVFIADPNLAALYIENWRTHREHSTLPPMVPTP